jgi:hypothetical protein
MPIDYCLFYPLNSGQTVTRRTHRPCSETFNSLLISCVRFDPEADEESEEPGDEAKAPSMDSQLQQQQQTVAGAATSVSVVQNLKAAFSQSKPFAFSFLGGQPDQQAEFKTQEETRQSALFR